MKNHHRISGRALTLAMSICAAAHSPGQTPAAQPPPSIVLVVTDDQFRNQFNFLREGQTNGRSANLTPNMDRLVSEGAVLKGYHVVSPVCTPSRYSTLTGKFASRANNPDFLTETRAAGTAMVKWNTHIVEGDTTLQKLLRDAGYVTGFVGKNHVIHNPQMKTRLPGDLDPAAPEAKARLAEHKRAIEDSIRKTGFDFAGGVYNVNAEALGPKPLCVHNMDWCAETALDFLDQCKNTGKPFFLYFASTLVHAPYTPERSWNANPLATPFGFLEKAPSVLPARSTIPERLRKAGIDPEGEEGSRKASLLWMDDALGALLAKLEELHMEENTIILFANDNGQEDKGALYEGGALSVSFIWKKGGFAGGKDIPALTANIDIAPTLLDFAGVSAPKGAFDGVSWKPLLDGKTAAIRNELFLELGFTRGLIKDGFKYIALRYPENYERFEQAPNREGNKQHSPSRIPFSGGKSSTDSHPPFGHIAGNGNEAKAIERHPAYWEADQLYELSTDPDEKDNLAESPRHAERLAAMKLALGSYLTNLPGGFGELKD